MPSRVVISNSKNFLTLIHFSKMLLFYNPKNIRKQKFSQVFRGFSEMEHLPEVDYLHNSHKYNDINFDKKN